MLPYFKRHGDWHGGEDGWRGSDGPLHVTRGPTTNPLYDAFIEAGAQAGFEITADYNGSKQEGFGADGDDGLERPPLVGGQRLSPPGAASGRTSAVAARASRARIASASRRAVGVEIRRWRRVGDGDAPARR